MQDFTTYNSVQNCEITTRSSREGERYWKSFEFPFGTCEIILKLNNGTFKSELKRSLSVNDSKSEHSIGRLLGSTENGLLKAKRNIHLVVASQHYDGEHDKDKM